MKPFINISLCCFAFLLCLSAQAQEKSEEALVKSYNAIIGNYWEKPVEDLPKNKRDAILIAKAKKMVLRKDEADYFGVHETPKIEYVKLKKGFYMPRDECTWGEMAYRINFYKSPDKKELKHIVYILKDSGQIKFKTNITFITVH